jgi:hypothetical protein
MIFFTVERGYVFLYVVVIALDILLDEIGGQRTAGCVWCELTAPSRSSAPSFSAVDMRQDMLVS